MAMQPDLFGGVPSPLGERPHGLDNWESVISAEQEAALIARIDATELSPFRFQGWLGKRLTRSFGYEYEFDNGRFDVGDPMPDWLLEVRDTLAERSGIPSDRLVQALLIRYDPGAGIGWHRDRPVFEHIVGLSLGNQATLRFRRRAPAGFQRFNLAAPRRSLYRLSGEARQTWEHSIAEMTVPRWSITFRTLAER